MEKIYRCLTTDNQFAIPDGYTRLCLDEKSAQEKTIVYFYADREYKQRFLFLPDNYEFVGYRKPATVDEEFVFQDGDFGIGSCGESRYVLDLPPRLIVKKKQKPKPKPKTRSQMTANAIQEEISSIARAYGVRIGHTTYFAGLASIDGDTND